MLQDLLVRLTTNVHSATLPQILQLLINIIDIFFVAVLLYYFFLLIKDTRAVQIIQGIGVLLVLLLVCQYLKLRTTYWIVHYLLFGIVVALPIVFQPELRRALGKIGGLKDAFDRMSKEDITKVVDEIVWSCSILSQTKTGALIVFQREMGLEDIVETGTRVNGEVSSMLLLSIFNHKSPLHDGAVMIRGNKVEGASCYLPLAEEVATTGGKKYGARHRAALGLTEQTDAVVVVVSEETGNISVARQGNFIKNLNMESLKKVLMGLFAVTEGESNFVYEKLSAFGGKVGIRGIFKKKSGS
jgi:diadenylate cyclase